MGSCEEGLRGPIIPPLALHWPWYESAWGLFVDKLVESGVDLVHERFHEAGGGQVQVRRGLCVEAEGVGEGA